MLPALLSAAHFAQNTLHASHAQLHANELATTAKHAQTRPSMRAQRRRHCVHAARHASKAAIASRYIYIPRRRAAPRDRCEAARVNAHTCTYGVFEHRRCPARDKGIAGARRHLPAPEPPMWSTGEGVPHSLSHPLCGRVRACYPNPAPKAGGGGEIELRPSAREAQPPGGTRLNLSERHTRAHPHVGGRGGARGEGLRFRPGRLHPQPQSLHTRGHHTATCRGLRFFLGACTALGGKPSQIFP